MANPSNSRLHDDHSDDEEHSLSSSYLDVSTYSPFVDSYSPLSANDGAGVTGPSHQATTMTTRSSPLGADDTTSARERSTQQQASQTQPQSQIQMQHLAVPSSQPSGDGPHIGYMTPAEQQLSASEQLLHPAITRDGDEPCDQDSLKASDTATPLSTSEKPKKGPRVARFVEMLKGSSPSPSRHLNVDSDTAYAGVGQVPPNISQFDHDEDDDHEELVKKFNQGPPLDCHSAKDVHVRRRSSLFIIQMVLSVYSTVLSGLWLVVALYQPRYGRGVSSSSHSSMVLSPSTASVLSTLLSKTIEMSFVTIFVTCLGQVLSRRGFVKQANGVTLAEMTMRNWVLQPGSLFTYWQGIPRAGTTLTGVLALVATLSALFYTTAADALVSPKLRFGNWYSRDLQGLVRSSYSNPMFVQATCPTPIDENLDEMYHGASCLDIKYSGQSYHNLLTFMNEWERIHDGGNTQQAATLQTRPNGKHSLFDNTTMTSSWIEQQYGDPVDLNNKYKRIVNNVTLAMPHPGVYEAATDPVNGILQPIELSGVGEYSIKAQVVSPAVNVMCVNMKKSELTHLVYTEWPGAKTEKTEMPGQITGKENWESDVPPPKENEWLNKTAVDDIFRWGEKYKRRPPVFRLYPYDFNMITNTTVAQSDAIYLLAKSAHIDDYTVCEMRSWLSPKCSTHFDISGTTGSSMKSHCEDPDDQQSYLPLAKGVQPLPSVDWKNMVDQWRLSMDLNGGISTSNASTSRIMTNFILMEPRLDPMLPSMAEAMAALSSSTLIGGALQSTFRHFWNHTDSILTPGEYEAFPIVIQEQQYTSAYESDWQRIFYVVLAIVFIINVTCFLYLVFRRGMVTDFTEPQNMFSLAINSPPSQALRGSCGGGPDKEQLREPWRIAYSEAANHYYFQESGRPSAHGVVDTFDEYSHRHYHQQHHDQGHAGDGGISSGAKLMEHREGRYRSSYQKLASSKIGSWL